MKDALRLDSNYTLKQAREKFLGISVQEVNFLDEIETRQFDQKPDIDRVKSPFDDNFRCQEFVKRSVYEFADEDVVSRGFGLSLAV